MKKSAQILGVLAAAAVLGGLVFASGCAPKEHPAAAEAGAKRQYTCGMHPQIVRDAPGNCPICGMALTLIRKPAGATAAGAERKVRFYKSTMKPGEISPRPGKDSMGMDMVPVYEDAAMDASTITIDPVTRQNMGLRTAPVSRGPLRRVVRTVGVIDYDETALADVTTKFKGWVEKLYVDATGKQVHRGEALFEIYSPELYTAQTEYLLAIDTGTNTVAAGANGLRLSARQKLKYFDISDTQIQELETTRQPKKTLRVNAPIDGFVVEKMVVEGQMVDAGMRLYRLADLALVWVQAQIYEQDLALVQLGQEATVRLSYLADRKFRGRVTYVYPTVDDKTRTAKVRMEFHNPGYFLKPGMFATVEFRADLEPSALLVPDSAVLRSGERNTVFVALPGGRFDARTVTLGPRSEDDRYQVLRGLNEGEVVVTSGQFLLDSESQLREAIQKMSEPNKSSERQEREASERKSKGPSVTLNATNAPRSTSVPYICPMPEHVSIEYNRPGKCPVCGMTLIPVSPGTLPSLSPGGRVDHYTCPMVEHSDLRADKPGKCPRCGMTLIPVTQASPTSEASERGERVERERVGAPSTLRPADAPRSTTLYTCPMAEHADVVSDQPGDCSKCGMKLVPTGRVAHGKTAEENWRKQHSAGP